LKRQLLSKPTFLALVVLGVTILWVALFELNQSIFAWLKLSNHVHLIFLPAAVRLIAVLLFKQLGVISLFLGGLITGFSHLSTLQFSTVVILSAISAISPYIAVQLGKRYLDISDTLSNLQAKQLFIVCLVYAAINGLMHNFYLYISNPMHNIGSHLITMVIGDLAGCLIIFYLASRLIRYIRNKQTHAI
jgi:hypothetical protein